MMMLRAYLLIAFLWLIGSLIAGQLARPARPLRFSIERAALWPVSLADLTWLRWKLHRRRQKIRARLNALST